jgi:8-oxo-dGTP pyrophosphatase MutT (NUDIX family)
VGRTAIPLTEALRLFPKFTPQWQPHHPECLDPPSVALGDPKHGVVRHIVVVETDPTDQPIKPLWDQWRIEEGPVGRDFPGTIIVPFYFNSAELISIVLISHPRPIRGSVALEFPQGLVEGTESISENAARELKEETGLDAATIYELQEICAEPDWFPRGTQVVAARVDGDQVKPAKNLYSRTLGQLTFLAEIDSATSLAALMRFVGWARAKNWLTISSKTF